MEEQERGWYSIDDKFACADCFEDSDIQSFIEDNAVELECSYCGTKSDEPIAADMNDVMQLIMDGIHREWGDPNNEGMSYESREGGWMGRVLDSSELFDEIGLGTAVDELYWDIYGSIQDRQWCQRDLYRLLPQKELMSDWEYFCQVVMHETRFVFFKMAGESDRHYGGQPPTPAHIILDTLAKFVIELDLVITIPAKETFYRARVHDEDKKFSTIEELGPPPNKLACFSNRMSPAGIPMFYGSESKDTAIKEITHEDRKPKFATIGTFATKEELRVLDLTRTPADPGLFDRDMHETRPVIMFLNAFIDDLTRPIIKDGREHIEYVPSQIVTEYFRHLFRDEEGNPLHGILFPSAVDPAGKSCVLFFGPAEDHEFFPDENAVNQWMSLEEVDKLFLEETD